MKTSLLLLYICEWLQKEGMVAVPLIKNELDSKGVNNQFEQEHKREIASKQRGYDMEL